MKEFDELREFESFYDKIKPAYENSENSFVWFTDIPHPLFNTVMHLRDDSDVDHRIENMISLTNQNSPLSFWVHSHNGSNDLKEILKNKGFQSIMTCPLMTWDVKHLPSTEHRIEKADFEIFNDLLAKTFHFDENLKTGIAQLFKDVDAENYLIYHKDQPVGVGSLIPHQMKGGIFNIAIQPETQKQGYGKAMMQFLMIRAAQLSLRKLLLLSPSQTENFYLKLGFKKSFDIEIYVR